MSWKLAKQMKGQNEKRKNTWGKKSIILQLQRQERQK